MTINHYSFLVSAIHINMQPLEAEDIASAIVYSISSPPRVQVSILL